MNYSDNGGFRDGSRERGTGNREGGRPRFNRTREVYSATPENNNSSEQHQRRSRFTPNAGDGARRPRFERVEGTAPAPRPRFERIQGERPRFTRNTQDENNPRRRNNAPELYSGKKRIAYKEKFEDPTKPIRLNKYLANAGICSRREADDFILAGVISVNGVVVSELGAKVLPTDKVMFHQQPVRREKKVYILLNKPKNTVTTTDDPQERHTVIDIVKNACSERIYPVGRLDRNTTGVLLLTNDGDLASKLTHPKFEKKKVYAATLDKDLTDEAYNEIMAGILLDDELIIPDALEFPKEGDRKHVGLQIHSGQNRVVRRIFEKVGYKVVQLDRVSFAGLTKKNLPRGKYRFLTQQEVNFLMMGNF